MPSFSTIGIDPGLTNVGVCIRPWEGSVFDYLIRPKALRGVERHDHIARDLEGYLREVLGEGPLTGLAVIEGPDYKGFSTIPLAEINSILGLTCYRLGFKILRASPSQVKKFATGNSQADKAEIMARYGYTNEHLADARALAEIGAAVHRGTSTIRHELEVVKRLVDGKPKPKAPIKKLMPRALAI